MAPSVKDVEHALAVLSEVDQDFFLSNEVGRQKALSKSRALTRRLEKPREALVREIWMQPMTSVAIKIGQDTQLFNTIPLEGPGMSPDELAQLINATPEFLIRFLHLLSSIHMIKRTVNGKYLGTTKLKAFTEPGLIGGMTHLFTQVWPCFSGLPEYLQRNGYRNPEDITQGPWQHGLNTTEAFFDWLAKRPVEAEGFHNLMACAREPSTYNWTTVFPVQSLVSEPLDLQTPLIVDIGGGTGSDMMNLRDVLHPKRVRLEVQDVESVVAQAQRLNPNSGIAFRAHDFFEKQPISGAKVYFMHSILHDWPDRLAVKILRNIHCAMKPGYSRLLLCESIAPSDGRSHILSTMDLLMMGLLCSKERTEDEWVHLLNDARFQLEKIWSSRDRLLPTLIEAVPIYHKSNM